MAVTLTLARYDPEPINNPERIQVGYQVTLDDATTFYTPVTILVADLPDTDEATVRAAAEAEIVADAEARSAAV